MTQADIPKKKPSEELQALRQRVAELEALETKRQADNQPLPQKDESLFKAVFESAHDSLFLVDKKGYILDFNDRLTEFGGYEKEELVGKNIRSLAGKVTRKSLVIMITNLLKRMANIHVPPYEVEMYKKNGELVTVEISARPLRKDGKIIGDLAILRDVTERKRSENEIRQRSSELQLINSINDAANRGLSLTELIQVVSEEIQTLYGGFAAITYFLGKDKQSLVARNYKFPSRMVHAIEKLIHMKMSDINFRLKEGSIHSEALKTGKVQVTNDILALQQIPEEYTDDKTIQKLLPLVVKIMGLRSVITVPLISEGEAIGLLDIARHEPLTDCNLERMQTIASQFVNVIKRKQAEGEIYQKTSEIQLINSFNDAANRSLGLKEIIKLMSIGIQELYGGFASTTHLISDDKQYMEMHFIYPHQLDKPIETLLGGKIPEIKYKLKANGIYAQILKTGKVHVTDDPALFLQMAEECTGDKTLLKLVPPVLQILGLRSVITVPLISEGEAIGLLDIARHEPSIEYDLERLQTISKQFVNVIKRKQAEEALKISEQNFRNSMDSSFMGIYIADTDWHILYVNQAFLDIYGYKNIDEVRSSPPHEHYTPEEYARHLVRTERLLRGEPNPDKFELDIVNKDGTIRHVQAFRREVLWDGKQQYQLLYNDITERKQAEKALIESETRYHELVDTITSGVFIYRAVDNGEDFVFVDINSAAEKMEGINRKDIIGRRITEVLTGARDFYLFQVFQKVWRTGNSEYFQSGERQDERETGRWRDNWAYKLPSGEIVNVYNDITERKRAEEALKASEQNFRNSLDNSPMGIRISDSDGYTLYGNSAFLAMFGYENIEEAGVSPPHQHYTPEENARFQVRKERYLRGEPNPDQFEVDIVRKDGDIRHLQVFVKNVFWNGKQQHQAIYNDITERMRAEEALKASENSFRNSLDNSPIGIRISDRNDDTLYANQAFLSVFGYENIEELKTSPPLKHYTPAAYDNFLQRMEQQRDGAPRPDSVEIEIVRKDGDIRNLRLFTRELVWYGKQQFQNLYYDTTERKRSEEALKASEQNFRNSIDSSLMGIRIVDEKWHTLYANQVFLDIFGYKNIDEVSTSTLQDHYTPEEYARYLLRKEKRIRGEVTDTTKVDIVDKGGHIRHLEIFSNEVLWNGKKRRQITYNDITERQRAEEALKESETRYRELVNTITSGVIIYKAIGNGEDFVFVDINSAAEKLDGISRKDIIGKKITEVLPGSNNFNLFKVFQKVWQTGNSQYYSSNWCKDPSDPGKWRDNWTYKLPSGEIVNVYNDITDKKLAEEALKASEQKYSTLVEQSTDGIVILINRLVEFANHQMYEMTDYSQDEILGKYFYELTAPEYKEMLDEICKKMQAGEELTDNHEMEILTKDKRKIAVETKVQPIIYQGKAAGMVIIRDISERKQAEQALRASEEKYSTLIEQSIDAILILKNRLVAFANYRMYEMTGYSQEEILGKTFIDLAAPEYKAMLEEEYHRRLAGEEISGNHELEILAKDGRKIAVETKVQPIIYQGQPATMSIIRDISERKQAEQALRASEEKYSTLIEKSSDGIVILNVHEIEFSNTRMCEMSGYSQNEIMGKNFFDLVAPEDLERLNESYQGEQADGVKIDNFEMEILAKNKKRIPVETSAQIIVYKDRPATMVTIRDITQRNQAEEALKASEQNFRNSIDSSSLGIRISDIDNNTLYANQTLLDIFGYKDIDEVRAKSPQEYYSPESYADYLKMMDKYGRGEIIPDQVDIDIVRKDGTIRHLQTVFKEVFWDGKQQYQTLYNDITENKEIEIALRESEEKYRTIFESANDILNLLDANGKVLDVNKRITEMGGYDRYELIDKNITELTHIIDEKNMAIVVGNLWKMVNSDEAVTYQVEMIKKNREPIFLEINAVPIQKGGTVIGVLGILRDITERNKSELRIRESEEKYRTIFESANDILMLLDTNGKILDVNGRLTEIGGYDQHELIDKNFLELTHVIDKKNMAIVLANLQKIVAGSRIVTYQVEMVKKNREPIFMEINAVPILKEGKIIGVLAILRDITERNKSELQIRESEEKYRTIFESANDIIMLLDTKGKILDINGRLTEIGGYEKDELIGKNVSELAKIISIKSLPIVVTNLLKRMAGLEVSTYQVEMVKKNRELVNVEINAVPIRKDGKIIGDLAILRDITERRKSELQIREQKALTDRILKSTPNVVAVVGRDQRIIMVNKAFEQTFELGEGQAEDKNIGKFITVPHLVDNISHVLASGETKSQVEFRIKRGAAVRVCVADIISMQQNEVLIVLRDITEERELQERLYLTDRLASVGEMAAGIAHELNNPLTGVVALSQLLLESGVPDEMKDDIAAISKEGQRAAEVVRNLLSFARSHTLSISSTEINSVIKEVLSLRAYEHNVNNIIVTTNLAPDLPEIMTDRFQMQQVFLNIILNAEHAMIEANGRGNLIVTSEQNVGIIKISFTNDGPSIPPDIINRIFDPFFTTKDVGKGTGLGLSICYGIVTKQGGKIYARSQEGKGATFIIELPLKSH